MVSVTQLVSGVQIVERGVRIVGGELRGRKEGKNEGRLGREPSLISLQSFSFFFFVNFWTALYNLNSWNQFLMTLPHFLEITRDLFFCSGARSAWSRGSGSKPSQAERQVSVFISWHFLHPYTSLFHSCSCFLVVKLKLEVTDSKRLNNLFTANGKYNHVTISYA